MFLTSPCVRLSRVHGMKAIGSRRMHGVLRQVVCGKSCGNIHSKTVHRFCVEYRCLSIEASPILKFIFVLIVDGCAPH